ncbi:DUF1232 domain-containing protein [Anaerolineales bacterium HSG6]|nr:DUF1232 domain-containing protein [Anaerolineales bacterium HSG6]MDM8530840.1 DUF1232 domain-containing protein [Anaerolineales bacterium HSG25]
MTAQDSDPNGGLGIMVEIIKRLRLVWALFMDSRVPIWTKSILPMSWVYLISPIDLIPDMMLGVGQMDDLGVLLLAMALFVKVCPQDIVQDYMDELEYGDGADDDIIDSTYKVLKDQD